MEVSIPVNIPSLKEIRGNISSSQSCSRKTSLIECGSFFSASSVNHPRNSVCLSVPMEDPNVERKLSRTRKMSETNRSVDSRYLIVKDRKFVKKFFLFFLKNS